MTYTQIQNKQTKKQQKNRKTHKKGMTHSGKEKRINIVLIGRKIQNPKAYLTI